MYPPSRIVCLTEETVETLYLLGEDRRIVGVSGYAVRPPRVRKEKPRVSAFISADVPKILALEPDLVLAFSDLQADIVAQLIRAGVENPEMVEALGYRIRRLFVSVFIAGSALAGLGGVMWAFYRQTLTAGMGMEVMVLVFIVIIIGGLGSVGGCFVGALLVGLVANYIGYVAPKLALGSNILLMVLILLWRPRGLYPVGKA